MSRRKMGQIENPAALVAIAWAAHQTNDRDLERSAKSILLDRFGIKLSFTKRVIGG